ACSGPAGSGRRGTSTTCAATATGSADSAGTVIAGPDDGPQPCRKRQPDSSSRACVQTGQWHCTDFFAQQHDAIGIGAPSACSDSAQAATSPAMCLGITSAAYVLRHVTVKPPESAADCRGW